MTKAEGLQAQFTRLFPPEVVGRHAPTFPGLIATTEKTIESLEAQATRWEGAGKLDAEGLQTPDDDAHAVVAFLQGRLSTLTRRAEELRARAQTIRSGLETTRATSGALEAVGRVRDSLPNFEAVTQDAARLPIEIQAATAAIRKGIHAVKADDVRHLDGLGHISSEALTQLDHAVLRLSHQSMLNALPNARDAEDRLGWIRFVVSEASDALQDLSIVENIPEALAHLPYDALQAMFANDTNAVWLRNAFHQLGQADDPQRLNGLAAVLNRNPDSMKGRVAAQLISALAVELTPKTLPTLEAAANRVLGQEDALRLVTNWPAPGRPVTETHARRVIAALDECDRPEAMATILSRFNGPTHHAEAKRLFGTNPLSAEGQILATLVVSYYDRKGDAEAVSLYRDTLAHLRERVSAAVSA